MDKELLYRFFTGETSEKEEEEVLDWIDSSEENRKVYLKERALFDALLLHVDERKSTKRNTSFLPLWGRRVLRYAAIIILAFTLGHGYTLFQQDSIETAYNIVKVPAGQHIDLTLSDGTQVSLNALSELKYPSHFAGKTREVSLKGEAFFDVSRNEQMPFKVETFACEIEVLGTEFDVEAYPESGEFSTTLVEGSVRITDTSASNKSILLAPNQQATLRDGKLVVGKAPHFDEFLWREGLIAFRNASFEHLLSEFEKHFGVNICLNCKNIPSNLFTGKIRISDGLDHALWVLGQSADFKTRYSEDKNYLYIEDIVK